jgi:hypothetical protein
MTINAISVLADSTARTIAQLPRWAQPLANDTLVVVDAAGVAHKSESKCSQLPDVHLVDVDTLIHAMSHGVLCHRCG